MKNDDGLPGVVIPALPQAPMGPIRVRLQAWFQPVDLGNRVIGRSQCFHCLLGYFVPTIGSPAPAEIEQAPAKKKREVGAQCAPPLGDGRATKRKRKCSAQAGSWRPGEASHSSRRAVTS